jgi:hypothetical protein
MLSIVVPEVTGASFVSSAMNWRNLAPVSQSIWFGQCWPCVNIHFDWCILVWWRNTATNWIFRSDRRRNTCSFEKGQSTIVITFHQRMYFSYSRMAMGSLIQKINWTRLSKLSKQLNSRHENKERIRAMLVSAYQWILSSLCSCLFLECNLKMIDRNCRLLKTEWCVMWSN